MSVLIASEQLRYFEKQQRKIVKTIRQFVEIESPSDVKQSVDRLGTVLASRFAELGGRVRVHLAEKFGNHLQVDFAGRVKWLLWRWVNSSARFWKKPGSAAKSASAMSFLRSRSA